MLKLQMKRGLVMKAKLYKPNEDEILNSAGSIDDRRNAIGFIQVNDFDQFCSDFIAACKELGIEAKMHYVVWLGPNKSYRITISECELTKEVNRLSKRPTEVGIFFEHPTIRYEKKPGGGIKKPIDDESRYMIWIYRTINKKALTLFRKFLLKHIVEYVKEE
jgi:hypothetical protein